jgi:ABC-2 type transport system ATP-binding protein
MLPQTTPPSSALISMSNVAAELVSAVLNPFGGTSPRTPTDTPASWMALAAARREIATASSSVAAVTSGPIVYVPAAEVVTDAENPLAGVITSSVQGTDANGLPLAYAVVSVPSAGGKVNLNPTTGTFAFLPDASVFTSPTHSESFSILVHEVTPFVSALAPLEALPIVGTFVDQTLTALYQVPVLNTLLVPLIGNAVVTPITVDVDAVNPSGNPIAFTTKVISFDGTPISTNFFPALGLQTGQEAPTLLNGPGLGGAGNTDPTSVIDVTTMVPGLSELRAAGYNVVTWDPRGEFASGGVLQLDSPAFEGKDVQAIINWVAQQPETQLDSAGDPRMGMVGGSYGGGIQLVTATIDPRVDAIVPTISWNSLTDSLYPKQTFLTSFGTLLVLSLVQAEAQINPQIYSALVTGDLLGLLSPSDVALLDSSGPGALVSKITAPTLLIQGTVDDLFPLQQAIINQQLLAANGIPAKMIWFCGGHGVCLDPGVDPAAQASTILDDELAWVNQYVLEDPDTPADTIPAFQWIDQNGEFFSSDVMPSNPAFQGKPISASSTGGTLPIVPLLGGSGPATLPAGAPLGLGLALGTEATNALNLSVPVSGGTHIVGAPALTITYSGIGTSRAVYAQIVDEQTGRVLGNIVTPIPVTLDGQTRTVSVALGQLADIAYTAPSGGGKLTLQLVGSATPFENLTSIGVISVSNMTLSLPTVKTDVAIPESTPAADEMTALV